MQREGITEMFTTSDLEEMLKGSEEFLATIDEIIKLTPLADSPSVKQVALRLLFMDGRTAAYDIFILAESLLRNDSHLFSRALEFSIRLLHETMIDYFYIFESDNSLAQRYLDFLDVVNNKDSNDYDERLKDFESRYERTGRGCHWSGTSRKDKIIQGLNKQPKNNITRLGSVTHFFDYLNEQVHGNVLVGYYWDFDKYGKFEHVYRGQVMAGLSNIWIFYIISEAYCGFTGRVNEVKRFEHYESHIKTIVLRNFPKERSQ